MYKISKFSKEKKTIKNIRKIVKTSINILVYLILVPILILNFVLIIKSVTNPNEIPHILGYKVFVIVSKSMEPELNVNDSILVKEVNSKDIKIGDIISFYSNEQLITHRVIDLNVVSDKIYYTTKGDNNSNYDINRISYENVEGKYLFKISNFANLYLILKSPITFFSIILLIVLNYFYTIHLQNIKMKRKQKRNKYEMREK